MVQVNKEEETTDSGLGTAAFPTGVLDILSDGVATRPYHPSVYLRDRALSTGFPFCFCRRSAIWIVLLGQYPRTVCPLISQMVEAWLEWMMRALCNEVDR